MLYPTKGGMCSPGMLCWVQAQQWLAERSDLGSCSSCKRTCL